MFDRLNKACVRASTGMRNFAWFVASFSACNRRLRKAVLMRNTARFNYYLEQHNVRYSTRYPQTVMFDDNQF